LPLRPLQRWIDPHEIEASTPDDRDRVADLLRLTAIGFVVLGHWLVTAVLYRNDDPVVGQALQWVPQAHLLTWIFQVMPLFFFVGGHLNATSWRRAEERGRSWPRWFRRRARRLLTPMLPVFVVAVGITVGGARLGIDDQLVTRATEGVLLPLWFLVVYILVIAIVPVTLRLHDRYGLWVPALAVVATGVVDALIRAGTPVVGFASYLLLWGGIHQLGYFWNHARMPDPGRCVLIALGATMAVATLIIRFDYPLSMVAVFGAERHNTDPPSLALWLYAIAQLALVVAVRRPLQRLLARPRVWAPVVVCASAVLTIFLWHMTAMVAVGLAVHPTGLWPRFERIDAGWWAMRPVWLLACALVLGILVAVFRRLEDQAEPVPRDGSLRTLVGLGAFAFGLARIMIEGLDDPTSATGLRLVPLVSLLAGMGLLGALWPRGSPR